MRHNAGVYSDPLPEYITTRQGKILPGNKWITSYNNIVRGIKRLCKLYFPSWRNDCAGKKVDIWREMENMPPCSRIQLCHYSQNGLQYVLYLKYHRTGQSRQGFHHNTYSLKKKKKREKSNSNRRARKWCGIVIYCKTDCS